MPTTKTKTQSKPIKRAICIYCKKRKVTSKMNYIPVKNNIHESGHVCIGNCTARTKEQIKNKALEVLKFLETNNY